jgi:hypothetical protein
MLYKRNELDLSSLIDAIPRSILRWTEKAKLALPIAQYVGFETGEVANLSDREEFLHWL